MLTDPGEIDRTLTEEAGTPAAEATEFWTEELKAARLEEIEL